MKIKFLFFAAFTFLGFLVYSNTLYSPFISYDEWYIVTNHQIRDISFFLKDFSGPRYVGFLTFAINYYFGGLNTFGYHIVNVVIHILNAILVYYFVILTFTLLSLRGALAPKQSQNEIASALPRNDITPNFIAFSVSLIFLVHPIQTQAVSWICQRFTSLAAFFYLLALVLYVKARLVRCENRKNCFTFYILLLTSYLSAILAMKTKEISFTLPFIIILYEFTFLKPFKQFERFKLLKQFVPLIPYLLTLIIIPLALSLPVTSTEFDELQRQEKIQDFTTLTRYTYLLTQFNVIVTYIRLLSFPVNQRFAYDYSLSTSIFEIKILLSLVFLLMIFSFAVYLWFRSRITNHIYGLLISFGILWFFITLSVESSVIPIADVIVEHRVYLPSIGAIIAFTTGLFYGLEYAVKRWSIKISAITLFLSLIFVFAVIFSIAAYRRNLIWKDRMAMVIDILKKSPGIAGGHNNIGNIYSNYPEAHNNLGVAYYEQGLFDEAIKEFLYAVKLKPDYADAYYNLGNIYKIKGLKDEAKKEFEMVLKLKPDDTEARQAIESFDYTYKPETIK